MGCGYNELNRIERLAFQAAGQSSESTNACIIIHPGTYDNVYDNLLRILLESGAKREKIIMGHVERTLVDDYEKYIDLINNGCTLEFDFFGWEPNWGHATNGIYSDMKSVEVPHDFSKIKFIKQLVNDGYDDKIVISHDICMKTRLKQ